MDTICGQRGLDIIMQQFQHGLKLNSMVLLDKEE